MVVNICGWKNSCSLEILAFKKLRGKPLLFLKIEYFFLVELFTDYHQIWMCHIYSFKLPFFLRITFISFHPWWLFKVWSLWFHFLFQFHHQLSFLIGIYLLFHLQRVETFACQIVLTEGTCWLNFMIWFPVSVSSSRLSAQLRVLQPS